MDKEETLEDAAERNHNEQKLNTYTPYSFNDAFIDGANWQAERMYSEDEVGDIIEQTIEKFYKHFYYLTKAEMKDIWFEQFKKK